jgi:hypothetical protein
MKILLGDFNAKVGREDICKLTIENESSHEISNDNGVRVLNFATKIRERLGGTKRPVNKTDMDRFNLKKLNEGEVKKQCQVTIKKQIFSSEELRG